MASWRRSYRNLLLHFLHFLDFRLLFNLRWFLALVIWRRWVSWGWTTFNHSSKHFLNNRVFVGLNYRCLISFLFLDYFFGLTFRQFFNFSFLLQRNLFFMDHIFWRNKRFFIFLKIFNHDDFFFNLRCTHLKVLFNNFLLLNLEIFFNLRCSHLNFLLDIFWLLLHILLNHLSRLLAGLFFLIADIEIL